MPEREDEDMLDPTWTEEKGYSHVQRLMELLRSDINDNAVETDYTKK